LNKKAFFMFVLFFSGFLAGSWVSGGPKGTELLALMALSLITGVLLGVVTIKLIIKYKTWKESDDRAFTIWGCEIKISRIAQKKLTMKRKPELVKDLPITETSTNIKKHTCDMCLGEPVTLAGQKIKCPKCKGKATA
jgi:hypothetical protein